MTLEMLAFLVLAVLAVGSAVVVISHRSSIVAALALAFNLISIAGFFFLLSTPFIAVIQVIVYAGAIMVLILFVLMLLNVQDERHLRTVGLMQRLLAPLLALAFAGLLLAAVTRGGSASFAPPSAAFGTVSTLGQALFTRFFYPFEAISLLLVVAMIGAVLLAKRRL